MECASNESARSADYCGQVQEQVQVLVSTSVSASVSADWNSTVYDENQFVQAVWQQVLWTLVFAVIVLVATGGNIVVIWVVLEDRRMRTVTNYFLVNLSVADVLVSTVNVIFNFIYMLNYDWPFGHALCKITNFLSVLSIAASVFTLVAISVDRYIAIMSPLRPRMSRMTTISIGLSIWVVSALLSLPNLLFTTTKTEYFPSGQSRRICFTLWPDGPTTQSNQEYIYNVMLMVITYFLPITCMCFAYTRVGMKLWASRSIGENTPKQTENIRSKRRVVKMMIVVVIIFAVCWLPFHIYFIVTYHHREVTEATYIQQVYLAIYWLAMSNSMYNPIIYCWMNSRFRRGFQRAFCCSHDHREDFLSDRRRGTTLRYSCSYSPRNGTVVVPLHALAKD